MRGEPVGSPLHEESRFFEELAAHAFVDRLAFLPGSTGEEGRAVGEPADHDAVLGKGDGPNALDKFVWWPLVGEPDDGLSPLPIL